MKNSKSSEKAPQSKATSVNKPAAESLAVSAKKPIPKAVAKQKEAPAKPVVTAAVDTTVKKETSPVSVVGSSVFAKKIAKTPTVKPDAAKQDELAQIKLLQKKFIASQHSLQADKTWKKFVAERKDELEEMRDDILSVVQEVTRTALKVDRSNVSSASGEHQADAGSEAQDRDLALNLLSKDREALYEIDAALERIRLGRYGICEISQEIIPRGRLEARPYVRLTVQCQTDYEKIYGNNARYNPANSGGVGFAGTEKELESSVLLDENEE